MLRYLWVMPNTLIGLAFAILGGATGGQLCIIDGCLEAHGGMVTRLLRLAPTSGTLLKPRGAAALTLGHVILGMDAHALNRTRDHEHVHVRQYERWGPLFLPAYFIASIIAALRGQRGYRDNRFEREAYGDI
jgi:hypothetical protein